MPRIITQCYTSDLKDIVKFALSHETGTPLPDLSPKQKATLIVVDVLIKAGLTFEEIYTIRRIVFWDNGRWDYKFYHTPEAMGVRTKLSNPITRNLINEILEKIGTKLEDKE